MFPVIHRSEWLEEREGYDWVIPPLSLAMNTSLTASKPQCHSAKGKASHLGHAQEQASGLVHGPEERPKRSFERVSVPHIQ